MEKVWFIIKFDAALNTEFAFENQQKAKQVGWQCITKAMHLKTRSTKVNI
jgi:hypothetical protein